MGAAAPVISASPARPTHPMEHLLDPDYYPVKRLNQQLIEVSGLIEKCQNQKVGNSVVLIGSRALGPASVRFLHDFDRKFKQRYRRL